MLASDGCPPYRTLYFFEISELYVKKEGVDMANMEYLKDKPIAVLGGGAVGKTIAADCKLGGAEVRLFDTMPFAEKSLAGLEKTGILLDGVQHNRDCFERSGRAFLDVVTSDISKAVKGAGIICVSCGSWGHEPIFRQLIPHLEDGQVIMVSADNFGCLLLRKLMREMNCTKKVIIGGWSSAPYGTRIENINGYMFPSEAVHGNRKFHCEFTGQDETAADLAAKISLFWDSGEKNSGIPFLGKHTDPVASVKGHC